MNNPLPFTLEVSKTMSIGRRSLHVVAVVFALLMSGCSGDAPGQPNGGVRQQALKEQVERSFAVGSINGVPLRIPKEYLFFGVNYEGENWLDPKTGLRQPPTENTPIEHFGMLLLPDFEPLRSLEARREWELSKVNRPKEAKTLQLTMDVFRRDRKAWLHNRTYQENLRNGVRVQTRVSSDAPNGYAKQLDAVPGLVKWYPLPHEKLNWSVKDTYHDPDYTTFIQCNYPKKGVPRPIQFCNQYVWIEEIGAEISVNYESDFLPRWQETRDRLTTLVRSFVFAGSSAVPVESKSLANPTNK